MEKASTCLHNLLTEVGAADGDSKLVWVFEDYGEHRFGVD